MPIYDDFSAVELDHALWRRIAPPGGSERGEMRVQLLRGECNLALSPAERGEGRAESVMLSTRTWDVGRDPMDFSTIIATDAADDSPVCAAFGVFDAAGGTVLGFAVTGSRVLAVARESGDPLAPLEKGALEFSDLGVYSEPLRNHDLKIEYDPQRRIARWYVDEVLRLYREVPFDPRELTCAFGVLPLRALEPGETIPALSAVFGPILYTDESELEPDPFYSALPG